MKFVLKDNRKWYICKLIRVSHKLRTEEVFILKKEKEFKPKSL